MKYKAEVEKKMTIYKNAIIQNGEIELFYVLKPYNYTIYTQESVARNITQLHNAILGIEGVFGSEISFSMMRFQDILPPDSYLDAYVATARTWDPDFVPTERFMETVRAVNQNYCLLGINIDTKKSMLSLDDANIKTIAKDVIKAGADFFADFKQQRINTERIDELSEKVANVANGLFKPCPTDILLDYFIKRVYPSYNLVLDRNEDPTTVLAYVRQEFTPHFNYFEMSNSGVELLGAEQKVTYGCVIDIIEFPEEIIAEAFSLNHNWLVVNCKTLSKQQAKVKLSRKKADIEFDEAAARIADADVSGEIQDCKELAEKGIAAVSLGRKIVEADIHILVTAETNKELSKRRLELISALKDMGIIATFAPDQAKEYLDSFVRLRPARHPFLMDMYYPLSFRMTQGGSVGDFDSKFSSPIIGKTASKSEATGE